MADPVGSVLGYDILLKGEAEHPRQLRAWELPGGLSVATDDAEAVLDHRLTPFTLDSIVALVGQLTAMWLWSYGEFSEALSGSGHDPRLTLSPFLLRRVVREAITRRPVPDGSHRAIGLPELKAAEDAAWEWFPPRDRETRTSADAVLLFLRMLQAQYHDQLGFSNYVRETAIALHTIDEARARGLDLSSHYRETYGCTFEDITVLSLTLSSAIATNPGITFSPSAVDLSFMNIPDEVVRAYWTHCASSYGEFKERASSPEVSMPGYETYTLSPTIKWPLIVGDDGLTRVPIASDLLHRPARGFEIDSWRAIGSDSAKKGLLDNARGRTFERYVGLTLSAMGAAGAVTHADELFDGKHCDYVCQEGKSVTLVEAKLSWFSIGAGITKERDRLKQVLAREGGVADAVEQLDSSARAIRRGESGVHKGANLIGLIVVNGHEVGLNAQVFRDLVEEILEERGASPPIIKYMIANADAFADLAGRLRSGGSLYDFLRRRWDSPRQREYDLHLKPGEVIGESRFHPLWEEHARRLGELVSGYHPELGARLFQNQGAEDETHS